MRLRPVRRPATTRYCGFLQVSTSGSDMPDSPLNEGDKTPPTAQRANSGLTRRAVIIGLVATVLIDLWLHYAELVLGGMRGHTALANTSIPLGAFNVLLALAVANIFISRMLPPYGFTQRELVVIYVMTTTSTVLSSSGGLHFVIPTLTAAHWFASPENGWAQLFHKLIPDWMAQKNPEALRSFYLSYSSDFLMAHGPGMGAWLAILRHWAVQMAVWVGFMVIFATATLCISIILRRRWIDQERLPFPTVTVPLEITREGVPLFRDKLFWLATALTFGIGALNNLHLNFPWLPQLSVRPIDVSQYFTTAPWNAIGRTPVAFFPFAIGIGFLLPAEVAFSCWFFYLFTKAEAVWGAAAGWTQGAAFGAQSVFPYIGFQGAGAFLGLAIVSLWAARRHLKAVLRAAFGRASDQPDFEAGEARGYRFAVIGLILCFIAMALFAAVGRARLISAAGMLVLVFLYLIAATRIRAETGNAWPVGPDVDPFRFMTSVFGTRAFTPADLTVLTYVRAATAGQDFRGTCMPHQLDGLKMASDSGTPLRSVVIAMMIAILIGVAASFAIAVGVWSKFGALAKTDVWRSYAGRTAFNSLQGYLLNPPGVDVGGIKGIVGGALGVSFLMLMRLRYAWWPFHPVGYAMANTPPAGSSWMPFFIAWLAKVLLTRMGGMRLYRRALPFFLGLIVGDFLQGGFWTLLACFTKLSVYPQNW